MQLIDMIGFRVGFYNFLGFLKAGKKCRVLLQFQGEVLKAI